MEEHQVSSQTKELLARVDERTRSIQDDIINFRNELKNSFQSLSERIKDTEIRQSIRHEENRKEIDSLNELIDKDYIKKTEFEPIKKIVYGFVGFLLLSLGGMFIALLTKQPSPSLFERPGIIAPQIPGQIK